MKQTHTPEWAKGMQKIGPGVYVAGEEMHFSPEEVCEYFDVPHTPENEAIALEAITTVLKQQFPGLKIPITRCTLQSHS